MPIDEPDAQDVVADQVYAAPASAHAEATRLLADPAATTDQKADSLWTLGRSAYYANRVSDAVVYLREALPLVHDPGKRADLVLTLAPALSKQGHIAEALRLLEPAQAGLSVKQQSEGPGSSAYCYSYRRWSGARHRGRACCGSPAGRSRARRW